MEKLNKLCDYGCGQIAKYQFKNGKVCCSSQVFGCPNRKYSNPAWNKGLTKETDDRVLKYTKSMKKSKTERNYIAWNKGLTKETDDRVLKYTKSMKKSKKGKPNYKLRKDISVDGITQAKFRYLMKRGLYISWVRPILERDNFKCVKCGSDKKLEVHHIKPYPEIFSEALEICKLDIINFINWDNEEVKYLEEKILELHTFDLGITLCKKCHGELDEHRKRFFKQKSKK